MSTPRVALSVAGTDSGGAAGIAADLATFADHGLHAACVVTAVTAQDTTGVHAIHAPPLDVVAAQIDAVLGDLPVAVVKTGMLGSAAAVALVAERLGARAGRPLVVDPVLVATSGAALAENGVVGAYRDLLGVASVVTPNLDEARALLCLDETAAIPSADIARRVADLGSAVVLTGGPDPGATPSTCTDLLAVPGGPVEAFVHPRVVTSNDHGSGCTYASALAARLALGDDLRVAAVTAAAYVRAALQRSSGWTLGAGRGPVAHLPLHPSAVPSLPSVP